MNKKNYVNDSPKQVEMDEFTNDIDAIGQSHQDEKVNSSPFRPSVLT